MILRWILPILLTPSAHAGVDASAISQKVLGDGKVSQQAVSEALSYWQKNHESLKLSKTFLAVADFSKPSNKERLAIVNIPEQKIEYYKVAHGKGSDANHDLIFDRFSSRPGSYATPRGYHKMTTTYIGKHGLSLKMEGLTPDNKTSMARAIVLHGADYVSWKHTGRSLGCPAVEKKYTKKIIEQLKNGALFYHFNKKKRRSLKKPPPLETN